MIKLLIFHVFSLIDIKWLITLIIQILVAIGTLGLAGVAFYNIIKERRDRRLARSPVFTLSTFHVIIAPQSGLVQRVDLIIKNTGFGPAFNVELSCVQGTSQFRSTVRTPGFTVEGKAVSSLSGNHMGIEGKSSWNFIVEQSTMKVESAAKPLIINVIAHNLFGNEITQCFGFFPNEIAGGLTGEELPQLLSFNITN